MIIYLFGITTINPLGVHTVFFFAFQPGLGICFGDNWIFFDYWFSCKWSSCVIFFSSWNYIFFIFSSFTRGWKIILSSILWSTIICSRSESKLVMAISNVSCVQHLFSSFCFWVTRLIHFGFLIHVPNLSFFFAKSTRNHK